MVELTKYAIIARVLCKHIVIIKCSVMKIRKAVVVNLQCTMSMMRLLTDGGTPLEAMQRYGPMCNRFTLLILNTLPSTVATANNN